MNTSKPSVAARILDILPSATVRIADMVASMRRQGIEIVDFSAGRASESSPDYINSTAAKALMAGDTHQTMAQGRPEFREACAKKLKQENGIDADPEKNIMATLGCKNGLVLALMAILDLGDEVIIEDPCFVSYRAAIDICGGTPVAVPIRHQNRFRWVKDDLESAVTENSRVILFSSPQNPTGTVHTPEDLDIIRDLAAKYNLWVISDEIYERVTFAGHHHTCIATRPGMEGRSVTLMGFTKTFSMGGWRIGFVFAPEPVVKAMVISQQHLMTCAGSFTQAGAAVALSEEYPSDVTEMWRDWEKRCLFSVSELQKLPNISCDFPEGGFYAWIDISKTGENSIVLAERLLSDYRVALVPGSAFGPTGEGYLRMTCVRSWNELREGLSCLRQAFARKEKKDV